MTCAFLTSMGWVDKEGKDTEATVATFEADVASLPMDVGLTVAFNI